MEQKLYDVAIIGGGPGGYTAGLYCARSGFSVVVLEKLSPGGQMATTGQVDNYPGFEGGVDGFELGEKMQRGAERFGVETRFAEVTGVELAAVPKVIQTSEGEVRARAVVLATGASPREMGLPGEQELRGRGVAYCATCDGMMYRNKTVAVLGGGNSAVADALYLSKLCREVYLIHRRDTLRASKVYMDALKDSGIQILWNSRAVGLLRDKRVSGLVLEELDEQGYIKADETTRTGLPGVFAVGDVRTKPLRQIVTATADGATASHFIEQYLMEENR